MAPLKLVNPMGVESWDFKNVPVGSCYHRAAQTETGAEKLAEGEVLLRVTTLVPQVSLKVTQNRNKRSHDGLLRRGAHEATVRGFSFKGDHEDEGQNLGHRIRGPYWFLTLD